MPIENDKLAVVRAAKGALRFSFSAENDLEDAEQIAEALLRIVNAGQ